MISDGDIVGKYVTSIPKIGKVMDIFIRKYRFLDCNRASDAAVLYLSSISSDYYKH